MRWKWTRHHHHLHSPSPVVNAPQQDNLQEVMGAILLTSGPVSTRTAVNSAGPRALRGSITNQQYENAADALEKAGMGFSASWTHRSAMRRNSVFVKTRPSQLDKEALLRMNLCSPQEYERRYMGKAPKCISQKLRLELVAQGFVAEDQLTLSD